MAGEETESVIDFLPAILSAGGLLNTPKPDFVVSLPTKATGELYTINLSAWDIPANGTQAVKTTKNIQAAIDFAASNGFQKIRLPAGDFLVGRRPNPASAGIYVQGIEIPSDIEFNMDSGTILRMVANDRWNYCIIRIEKTESNVTLRGGRLIGDRYTHSYVPLMGGLTNHDEGHAICVEGADHVLIEDMVLEQATGDGVLVIAKAHDITIRNSTIRNNRRQGVSTVGSYRINIDNNVIHDTRGTNPEFGVDIEGTAQFAGFDRDIIIQNNTFFANRGGGVLNTNGRNVYIRNNTMTEKAGSPYRYTTAPITIWRKADAVISGNIMKKAPGTFGDGIIEYALGADPGDRNLIIHNNVCEGCGIILRSSSSGADIRKNRFGGHIFWLLDVKNVRVVGNDHRGSSSQNCFSFRFQNITGFAKNNTFNGAPYSIPLLPDTGYSNGCPPSR